MLKQSHLSLAVVKPCLVQVFAHFDCDHVASLVILAPQNLAKSTPTQLLQSLIAICQVISNNCLVKACLSVIPMVVREVNTTASRETTCSTLLLVTV